MKRFSMKAEIFIFLLLLSLMTSSCKTTRTNDSERINTIWTHQRPFGTVNDTMYLETYRTSERTDFVYYENPKDSLGIMSYSILENEDLVFFKRDTFTLSESSIIVFNSDSLRLLKYEYQNPLSGGMGCMLITKELGLLGTGLYVGEKKILLDWNHMNINEDIILKNLKGNGLK